MSAVPGVILAGGLASRMGGGDKPLLPLGEGRLIDHVIDRLSPQVGAMAINANGDPARLSELGLPILPDLTDDHPGPLAGVLAAMHWAAGIGARHVVTAAGDTPFFPRDLVERLAAAAQGEGKPIALAATREGERLWRHPTFGLWPVDLRDDLAAALEGGLRKVVQWTDSHGTALAVFEDAAGGDPFFNVNTPEDLAAAETMRERMA